MERSLAQYSVVEPSKVVYKGQPNVDFLGQSDGLCHISFQPDEVTTFWVKLDAASTAALKQKYLDLKALLEETLSITATIERKSVLTEVTETRMQ